jgi:long-subunit acyl-CoA synthetase (AMP-forming)
MRELVSALQRSASAYDGATAFTDGNSSVTRAGLSARVAALAEELRECPRTLGLLGENGVEWTVAQLAGWLAGKIMVPIPAFFSADQQSHILADSGVGYVIATSESSEAARKLGVAVIPVSLARRARIPSAVPGGGQIIYTSGSTGRPKGVRLELGQIEHSASMLAQATVAVKSDVYLSVLPLPLLLETICAICVPILVGARTEFDPTLTAAVARGQPQGIAAAFERHRPTTSVLVPELLAAWVGELAANGARAPKGLRFVASGGAPVASALAEKAWSLGIPLHEGYGLSECCSVVSVNRPGKRKPGTVGQPLPGLRVEIDDGEIVVDGPTVMAGYQNRDAAQRPWRTGDLGQIDGDGYLTIAGRKDNLIVTSYGRNVSPEWIEALLMADERIGACAVLGHGEPHLRALIIPSARGAAWFSRSPRAHALLAMAAACREAPAYAVPRDYVVIDRAEAGRRNLLTPNGRLRRALLAQAYADIKSGATPARCTHQQEEMTA